MLNYVQIYRGIQVEPQGIQLSTTYTQNYQKYSNLSENSHNNN